MNKELLIFKRFRTDHFRHASVLFLLALLLRVFWALIAPHLDPFLRLDPLHGDAASYDLIASNLMDGRGFSLNLHQPTVFWPPLYPLFLAGVYRIFGHYYWIARIGQALFGAALPVCFYFISKQFFNRRAALLSGVGLVIYPYLIYFGAWLIAEALFLALFAFAFYLAAKLVVNFNYRNISLFGFILGLTTLAKPTTLFFLPFLALWVILLPEKQIIGRRLGNVLLMTASVFVVLLPWAIRNYFNFDRFILVSANGGYTFLGANNPNAWGGHEEGFPPPIPGLNEAEREEVYYAEAANWIRANPSDFARLLVAKYRRLLSPLSVASYPNDYSIPGSTLVYLTYDCYLITALIGMVIALKKIRRIGFLYTPIIGVLISTGLFYGDARYTVPMVPSLVVFSTLSIDKVVYLLRETGFRALLKQFEQGLLVNAKK